MNESRIKQLQSCFLQLSQAETTDDLCRLAVQEITRKLGFDRCGISLYDREKNCKRGTWGTNVQGGLVSEHHEKFPLREDEIRSPTDCDSGIQVLEHRELLMEDKPVGKGWLVQCGIFDGELLLGWIFIDNLISQAPLISEDISLIRLFGTYVGQMIIRQRHTESYQQLNRELQSSYKKLAEKERLASLGVMVAGVSHELNTPLGVAMTSESHIEDLLTTLGQNFQSGALTRSLMTQTLAEIQQSLTLSFNNLERIKNLANRFRQLAVHQQEQYPSRINLRELLEGCCQSFMSRHPDAQLKPSFSYKNQTQENYILIPVFQEVIHLILENTLLHAYPIEQPKPFHFELDTNTRRIRLTYTDQGQGLSDEALQHFFSPFFTTNRQKGPGLGTSILYNLVTYQLGGAISANRSSQGGLQLVITLPL